MLREREKELTLIGLGVIILAVLVANWWIDLRSDKLENDFVGVNEAQVQQNSALGYTTKHLVETTARSKANERAINNLRMISDSTTASLHDARLRITGLTMDDGAVPYSKLKRVMDLFGDKVLNLGERIRVLEEETKRLIAQTGASEDTTMRLHEANKRLGDAVSRLGEALDRVREAYPGLVEQANKGTAGGSK